ncbi:hypothetical protein NW819_14090, partial [Synechococcus sp. R8-2]|uniref:hypothetical protein n=1 Tax=Synechococcus sp. R8-2 TaxID=2291959 RepID=UPI0039C1CC2C
REVWDGAKGTDRFATHQSIQSILLGEKLGVTAWETLSDQFDQSARPFHSPTCAPVADGSQLRLREAHSPPAHH